jgi:hypothetical protein
MRHPWLGPMPQPGCIVGLPLVSIIGTQGGGGEDEEEDPVEITPVQTASSQPMTRFTVGITVSDQGWLIRTLPPSFGAWDPKDGPQVVVNVAPPPLPEEGGTSAIVTPPSTLIRSIGCRVIRHFTHISSSNHLGCIAPDDSTLNANGVKGGWGGGWGNSAGAWC